MKKIIICMYIIFICCLFGCSEKISDREPFVINEENNTVNNGGLSVNMKKSMEEAITEYYSEMSYTETDKHVDNAVSILYNVFKDYRLTEDNYNENVLLCIYLYLNMIKTHTVSCTVGNLDAIDICTYELVKNNAINIKTRIFNEYWLPILKKTYEKTLEEAKNSGYKTIGDSLNR